MKPSPHVKRNPGPQVVVSFEVGCSEPAVILRGGAAQVVHGGDAKVPSCVENVTPPMATLSVLTSTAMASPMSVSRPPKYVAYSSPAPPAVGSRTIKKASPPPL